MGFVALRPNADRLKRPANWKVEAFKISVLGVNDTVLVNAICPRLLIRLSKSLTTKCQSASGQYYRPPSVQCCARRNDTAIENRESGLACK